MKAILLGSGATFLTFVIGTIAATVRLLPSSSLTGPQKVISQPPLASATKSESKAEQIRRTIPGSFEYVQFFNREHWIVSDFGSTWVTKDGGRTWERSYTVGEGAGYGKHIRGLSFINEQSGFLLADQQVLKTVDGGANWEQIGKLEFTAEACYFLNDQNGWAVGFDWSDRYPGSYTGAVFYTGDGGHTWQRKRVDLPTGYSSKDFRWSFNDVLFRGRYHGWIVADAGIVLLTEDGGRSWRLAKTKGVDYQRVNFADELLGWATYKYGNGPWGVALTTDGGKRWKLLNESFVYGTWPASSMFLSAKHGYSVSLELYETGDGGRQWNRLSGDRNVDDRTYDYLGRAQDGSIIAVGTADGKVTSLVSVDNGISWQ